MDMVTSEGSTGSSRGLVAQLLMHLSIVSFFKKEPKHLARGLVHESHDVN